MNNLLLSLSGAKNVEYADFVRNYELKNNCKIMKLQTGDPDFKTPEQINRAMMESLERGATHYTASQGIPTLRETLAKKLQDFNGIKATSDEVLVTAGGVHAIYLAIRALINPGDKVIIFEPYWMPYHSILEIAGAKIFKVSLDLPAMNEDAIFENFSKVYSDDVKLIISNSPSNPTGIVFSENFYKKVLNRISSETILLSDEVYEKIIYDGLKHVSPASLNIKSEQVVSVYSFSKTYAMTGWRIGYLHAHKNITKEILKLLQYTSTCVSPFIQEACVTALTSAAVDEEVNKMVKKYAYRRELLKSVKGAVIPSGAFYSFIKIPEQYADKEFSKWVVTEKHVAVSPHEAFGSLSGYYRVSFAVDDQVWSQGIELLSSL